jgi:hypothetical protein
MGDQGEWAKTASAAIEVRHAGVETALLNRLACRSASVRSCGAGAARDLWFFGTETTSLPRHRLIAAMTVVLVVASGSLGFADPMAMQPETLGDQSSGPPVIKLPLDSVEPPRDVAAREWNSPYCGDWDDGCVECERTAPGHSSQCHDEKNLDGKHCTRRAIICFKAMSKELVNKLCSRVELEGLYNSSSNEIIADSTVAFVQWYYDNNRKVWESDRAQLLKGRHYIVSTNSYVTITALQFNSYLPNGPAFRSALRCIRTFIQGN